MGREASLACLQALYAAALSSSDLESIWLWLVFGILIATAILLWVDKLMRGQRIDEAMPVGEMSNIGLEFFSTIDELRAKHPLPETSPKESGPYADKNLIRGIEGSSGRDALLSLEEILRSRQSIRSAKDSGEASVVTPAS